MVHRPVTRTRAHTHPIGRGRCGARRGAAAVAAALALLAPIAALAAGASSSFVCKLVGEGTHNGTNPASSHQPNLRLYGTDLGFSFKHGRRVYLLFGDTWNEANFICQPPALSDDSLGWINLAHDDDPDDCLDIHFPADRRGALKPLRVFDGLTELNMGAFRTPITGWSDNRDPYGYFSGAPVVLCNPTQDPVCPDGLQCQDGVWCVDPGSSAAAFPLGNVAGERIIAVSTSPLTPQHFRVGYRFATNKFLNATSRVIGRLDEGDPRKNIYEPTIWPRELLMWGRPNFFAWPGTTSDVYLLHHRLAALDGPGASVDWQPRYFAGLDGNQNPVWTSDQIFATPVIAGEELASVLQFSVAWVEPLARFVMLYSGRLPRVAPGATPGVYLRTAKHPWGPWSKPQLIWNAIDQGAYSCPGIMYMQGVAGVDCPQTDPYRPDLLPAEGLNLCPGPSPDPNIDLGVEYGVNILETFTRPGLLANTAVIYWNLSTWNPYRVVLIKTQLDGQVIVAP
jgi:hypothetical protein